MMISNKAYDVLKYIALVVLPALAAAYFTIAQIWGLPFAEEVVGTLVALDTLLGALLRVSSKKYAESDAEFDGALVIDTRDEAADLFSFDFTKLDDVNVLRDRDVVKLKVQNHGP